MGVPSGVRNRGEHAALLLLLLLLVSGVSDAAVRAVGQHQAQLP
jgi:hypothetical protein